MFRIFEIPLGHVPPLAQPSPGSLAAETVVVGDNAHQGEAAGKHVGAKAGIAANVALVFGPVIDGAGAITYDGFGPERLGGGDENTSLVIFQTKPDQRVGNVPRDSPEASGQPGSWNLLPLGSPKPSPGNENAFFSKLENMIKLEGRVKIGEEEWSSKDKRHGTRTMFYRRCLGAGWGEWPGSPSQRYSAGLVA